MELESNGSRFNCRFDGKDDGPCIVLSHGLAADMHMWDGIIPHLAKDYRIFRYDARGHGGSPATPAPYTLAGLGEDLVGLLDAAGLDKVHFVGLSMGGMVGMGLGLNHANRFLSLSICDARGHAPQQYRDAWVGRCEAVQTGGIEAMVEPSVTRWFTTEFQDNAEAMNLVRDMVRRTSVEGYCGCALALRDLDYEKDLSGIPVPTLFLVGDSDNGAPPAAMAAMQAVVSGAVYAEIAKAGHMSAVEQPEAFAREIIAFVSAH